MTHAGRQVRQCVKIICAAGGKEKSTPVGVGYGRPWIDQWRPGPWKGLSVLLHVQVMVNL